MTGSLFRYVFSIVMLTWLLAGSPAYAMTEVTYCIDPNWPPYEAYRNREHVGISAQYLKKIGEQADISFKLVPTSNWQESLEFVRTGQCMMVSMVNITATRNAFLTFSDAYFQSPNVIVARAGTPMLQGYEGLGDRTVGIIPGYRHADYLHRYYPQVKTVPYASEVAAMQSVADGDVDVMIGSLLSVNYHIRNQGLSNLLVVGYAEPHDSLRFGVNKAYADDLIPRLNDSIRSVPEAERVKIFRQWNTIKVRDHHVVWPYLVLGAAIIMALFFVVWQTRLRRRYSLQIKEKDNEIAALKTSLLEKNRTLEFLSSHDPVTGLYNRNQMIQRAEEEVSRFQRFQTSASLIVIELENGQAHTNVREYDDLLKVVASLCLTTVREVDVVSRFGAQQFVIMCPQTNVDAAKKLSDRLVDAIDQSPACNKEGMAVVAAVSSVKSAEGFMEWYDRTVKALYQTRRRADGATFVAD
ncbi:diguanylate cyclase [Alteromonas sp. CYL-A6]|uniref:diguanylate cyclase n=1 Tax=Alteromonas nitratireducens TaxID=3390813 RepID=UPI0034B8B4D4